MVPDRQKGWTDGRTEGGTDRMDGRKEGRTEWTDGRTHGRRQNYKWQNLKLLSAAKYRWHF